MREAPQTEAPQTDPAKDKMLHDVLDEAQKRMEAMCSKIEEWRHFDYGSESDMDKAIGYALRIKKAVMLVEPHVTSIRRIKMHVEPDPQEAQEIAAEADNAARIEIDKAAIAAAAVITEDKPKKRGRPKKA